MMKLILFLFFTFSVSAQIKGVVKDSITGKPIPYVGIWTNSLGISTSSDEKGKFKLDKNASLTFIEFFTTNYERKKLFIKDLKKEILLIPKKNIKIDSIILTNDFQKRVLDFDKKEEKRIRLLGFNYTVLIAQYIPYYESYNAIPFLKSILFDLKNSKEAVYKIRFFKPDSSGKPSEEIGKKEIICSTEKTILETSDPRKIKFKEELQMIDLAKYKILFPKEGLFVAIEIMDLDRNKNILRDMNNNEIQMLNPSLKIDKTSNSNVWKFENSNWIQKPDMAEFGIILILTN